MWKQHHHDGGTVATAARLWYVEGNVVEREIEEEEKEEAAWCVAGCGCN